jgi:hypothetical protein
MSNPAGKPIAHGTHRYRNPSRPGQSGKATQVLILDLGRDLGIEGMHSFEKGGGDLGPDPRLVTTHDDQMLGDHPGLPGSLR